MGRHRTNYECAKCSDRAIALGLCMKHYQQQRRERLSTREQCIRPGCLGYQQNGSFYCKPCTTQIGWDIARKHS